MLLALGAASSALDAIRALTSSNSSSAQASGFSEAATDPFSTSGAAPASGSSTPASGTTGFSQISPTTMSALLAAQGQSAAGAPTSAPTSPSGALQDLFSQIDANGDGQISKSEFENALGAGGTNLAQADDVFNKLDKNGDGSVSLSEMASALKGAAARQVTITTPMSAAPAAAATRAATSAATSADGSSRSAAAGARRCDLHVGHQQRRLDHDIHDQCRRIQGHDDVACGDDVIEQRDVVLQFPRADDSARGEGDFVRSHRVALAQRLSGFRVGPIVANYPKRSFHAGNAPGKGSAVAV